MRAIVALIRLLKENVKSLVVPECGNCSPEPHILLDEIPTFKRCFVHWDGFSVECEDGLRAIMVFYALFGPSI